MCEGLVLVVPAPSSVFKMRQEADGSGQGWVCSPFHVCLNSQVLTAEQEMSRRVSGITGVPQGFSHPLPVGCISWAFFFSLRSHLSGRCTLLWLLLL